MEQLDWVAALNEAQPVIADDAAQAFCVAAILRNVQMMMDKVGSNTSISDHKRCQETLEKAMISLGVTKQKETNDNALRIVIEHVKESI